MSARTGMDAGEAISGYGLGFYPLAGEKTTRSIWDAAEGGEWLAAKLDQAFHSQGAHERLIELFSHLTHISEQVDQVRSQDTHHRQQLSSPRCS